VLDLMKKHLVYEKLVTASPVVAKYDTKSGYK
jgi:hypothetical protein